MPARCQLIDWLIDGWINSCLCCVSSLCVEWAKTPQCCWSVSQCSCPTYLRLASTPASSSTWNRSLTHTHTRIHTHTLLLFNNLIYVRSFIVDYLRSSFVVFQVIEFTPAAIAAFIAMVGILSIVAQVQKQTAHTSFVTEFSFHDWMFVVLRKTKQMDGLENTFLPCFNWF